MVHKCGRAGNEFNSQAREALLKGKNQYSWPPCTH